MENALMLAQEDFAAISAATMVGSDHAAFYEAVPMELGHS
jgi:hypothetical protein